MKMKKARKLARKEVDRFGEEEPLFWPFSELIADDMCCWIDLDVDLRVAYTMAMIALASRLKSDETKKTKRRRA